MKNVLGNIATETHKRSEQLIQIYERVIMGQTLF